MKKPNYTPEIRERAVQLLGPVDIFCSKK